MKYWSCGSGWNYSRYADYSTFSRDKFRFQPHTSGQTVTGLTVNEKVNLNRKYYRRLRAILHDWSENGIEEEIRAEALTRNLSVFGRFLEIAAISCSEMLNFNNIASECGVSAPTIKEYFSILEDTLIGYMIPSYKKVIKRRLIQAPRFYYFDLGITNHLLRRKNMEQGSPEYGKAFEQFVIQELYAYCSYSGQMQGLSYWRTASGYEVDAVLGDAHVAIEIKSSREIHSHHIKGLKAFAEEHPDSRRIVVSNEKNRRTMGDVEIFPVLEFLQQLWTGSFTVGNGS